MSKRRVLLHVGTPKTGTSFVQDLLFQNRELLADQGTLYPADRFDGHFLAALDLMELPWGGLEEQAIGAWDRLAERVRAWEGTVIISHEILAAASPAQINRAIASFGEPEEVEVHIVLSVRDLVRQIPAEWQENIKHRRVISYADFLAAIVEPRPTRKISTWFWGVQEVPAILERWAKHLSPENVHLVTVPKPGASATLLWERFAAVFGLDPIAFDTSTSERSNPSLGVAETALIRETNRRVNDGVLANEHYREFVRELLAHRTLSQREGVDRLMLPPEVRPWAVDLSQRWIAELEAAQYDIVGTLDDLLPDAEEAGRYVDPDTVGAVVLEDVALEALVTLLQKAGELRNELSEVYGRLADLEADRDRAVREMKFSARAKRAVVNRSDTSRVANATLRAYRRLRSAGD